MFYAKVCEYDFSRHSESGYSDRPLMTGGVQNKEEENMKKNMRKILAMLMASTLPFALLTGCGGSKSSQPSAESGAPSRSGKDSVILATSGEPTRFFPCGSAGNSDFYAGFITGFSTPYPHSATLDLT